MRMGRRQKKKKKEEFLRIVSNIQAVGSVREDNVFPRGVIGDWWQCLTHQISAVLAVQDDAKQAERWIDFFFSLRTCSFPWFIS